LNDNQFELPSVTYNPEGHDYSTSNNLKMSSYT